MIQHLFLFMLTPGTARDDPRAAEWMRHSGELQLKSPAPSTGNTAA